MEPEDSRAAFQEELRQVEADLAKLRRTAAQLRRRIGEQRIGEQRVGEQRIDGQAGGTFDETERAIMITAAEEQEAFAAELEGRRDELLRRLGPG